MLSSGIDLLYAGVMAGLLYLVAAIVAIRRFVDEQRGSHHTGRRPPKVSILKPVCGDEPGLYENLHSFCDLKWPPLLTDGENRNNDQVKQPIECE